ncbi:hypothetical protein C8R45DRAFT_1081868 [Mycena sanguinolenta]|nr:hypothetical protein C8R45DRAFT_1081868 [Mycena sanguinolenta]
MHKTQSRRIIDYKQLSQVRPGAEGILTHLYWYNSAIVQRVQIATVRVGSSLTKARFPSADTIHGSKIRDRPNEIELNQIERTVEVAWNADQTDTAADREKPVAFRSLFIFFQSSFTASLRQWYSQRTGLGPFDRCLQAKNHVLFSTMTSATWHIAVDGDERRVNDREGQDDNYMQFYTGPSILEQRRILRSDFASLPSHVLIDSSIRRGNASTPPQPTWLHNASAPHFREIPLLVETYKPLLPPRFIPFSPSSSGLACVSAIRTVAAPESMPVLIRQFKTPPTSTASPHLAVASPPTLTSIFEVLSGRQDASPRLRRNYSPESSRPTTHTVDSIQFHSPQILRLPRPTCNGRPAPATNAAGQSASSRGTPFDSGAGRTRQRRIHERGPQMAMTWKALVLARSEVLRDRHRTGSATHAGPRLRFEHCIPVRPGDTSWSLSTFLFFASLLNLQSKPRFHRLEVCFMLHIAKALVYL